MPPSRSSTPGQRGKRAPKGFEVLVDKINEFKRSMREAESESIEYRRKDELLWPVLRINHQRSRYIWQMYIKKAISREVYDFCVKDGLVDAALVAKWKKPGYEHLCCLQCAERNTNFGSTCVCRVPQNQLEAQGIFECKNCGCRGCSGVKKEKILEQHEEQHDVQDYNDGFENAGVMSHEVNNDTNEPSLADLL